MSADFEAERVIRLRQLMGAGFGALAESFRVTVISSLASIEEALAQGRMEEARAVAHRLRSTLSQFGMMQAAAAAERFERHEKGADSKLLLGAIAVAHAAAWPMLESLLREPV